MFWGHVERMGTRDLKRAGEDGKREDEKESFRTSVPFFHLSFSNSKFI